MSGRILIADDDRAIREALSRALTLEGYDVVQAPDGARVTVLAWSVDGTHLAIGSESGRASVCDFSDALG